MKQSLAALKPCLLLFLVTTSCAEVIDEVIGITVEDSELGARTVLTNSVSKIRFFGTRFTNSSLFTFTHDAAPIGQDCNDFSKIDAAHFEDVDNNGKVATADVRLDKATRYYVCLKRDDSKESRWIHQGSEEWISVLCQDPLMPLWTQILIIIVLLSLTGLMAGLNLGLMSLDTNELKVISKSGTDTEKMHAKTIEPIRRHGNYLLCTILLSNVMINSTLTVLLDQLVTGIYAVIISTLSIVIFGDIVPQAICSRHGLAVGAKTVYITYLFMAITFPLSFPISKILDCVLGEEIGQVYDRQKLMEFIRVTKDYSELKEDEVNMITGAMNLKTKTAEEVMTRLEDVFMLSDKTILDFETVSTIQKRGYSRIPVFHEDRKNVIALFHAKDLAFVDPDDEMPIKTILEFYHHPMINVKEEDHLDSLLNTFKQGNSHLAFVTRVYQPDAVDPYTEIIGIVTLEDVIEELLQMEIIDETDILTDNRRKQKRKQTSNKDFSDFAKIGTGIDDGNINISPQMALAAFQFLSSSVDPFKPEKISPATLQKLMRQKIYYTIRINEEEETQPVPLYKEGEICDFFVLVIEGRVRVTIGREKLEFVSGPFSYFGVRSLMEVDSQIDVTADYSVDVIETTTYIKVRRQEYVHAYKANMMEKTRGISVNDKLDKIENITDCNWPSGISSPVSYGSMTTSYNASDDDGRRYEANLMLGTRQLGPNETQADVHLSMEGQEKIETIDVMNNLDKKS